MSAAREAPGPGPADLWRDRAALQSNPLPVWCRWRERFGDVVQLKVGTQRFVFVFHPEGVGYVMKQAAENFVRDTPATQVLRMIQGEGVATIRGEAWKTRRRLLAPWFFARQVGSYAPLMREILADFLGDWDAVAAQGGRVDLLAEMVSLAIRIGSSTLVGSDLKAELPAMETSVRDIQAEAAARLQGVVSLPLWLPLARHRRFQRGLAHLDGLIYAAIAARRAAAEQPDDVLGMLLTLRDPTTGAPLTDLEVRDELMTIAGAAHDTTGLTLVWTWLNLARCPAAAARFYAEVDTVLGGELPHAADLDRMPWSYQVLQETMRVSAPIYALMRRAVADDEVGGFRVRAGSLVLTSPYVTHRHPDFWADPEGFDPARFGPEAAAPAPYSFLPFGAGPHLCIGKNFALVDTQLIVTAIASRYRIEVEDSGAVQVQAGLSYRPDRPVWARITPT